ncbi:MAG TPA: nitroreductase family protein [Paludibacteraceae bacterium]|nr:nitroreductase family protein [Paludibacteraceae bacterium]HOU68587.1 nitroreductase family protein [Paludibacteraceae bacterium]HPH63788.1 nitroreductase family protein [Paludibacteraceae bacterium]HQF50421.1 nitroreductase family protein [Paludibacteraceae bacterium]
MTNFIDLVTSRRSIRKYEDRPVVKEKVQQILKAALMAPSSKRCTPWQFVVIDDKEKLQQLSVCREMGCKFMEGAPLAIVVLAEEEKSDVWVEDATIAAIMIQLQVEDLGLGSCWMQVRNRKKDENLTTEDYIKEIINAPAGLKVECVIGIGYKAEEKKPFDETRLQLDKIHYNNF